MYFEIDKRANLQVILSRTQLFLNTIELSNIKKNEIQTIVSELIYNIHKYAPKGNIDISLVHDGIQIVANDIGSGIKDIHKAFQEGYSTSDTLGLGLPAIIRMSDDFHAQTSENGTKITILKRILC